MKYFIILSIFCVSLTYSEVTSSHESILTKEEKKPEKTTGEILTDGSHFFLKDDKGVVWRLALDSKNKDYDAWLKLLEDNVGQQAEAKHRPGHIAIGQNKFLLVTGLRLLR